ncbi:MAG: HTTM domain-containing protein [Planctomycetales bacterium]
MTSSGTAPATGGIARRIGRFFHAEEVPYSLALARIALPIVLLVDIVPRWPVARELFSTDGAPAQLSIMYGQGRMLPEFPGGVAVALFALLCFFLATSAAGWFTRVSLAGATLLYFYFNMLDSISMMTKYSVIATHGLFLLTLSECGSVWSLDALRERARRAAAGGPALGRRSLSSPIWPRRLMQILIGTVYFGAAVTKMHTPAFFSGDQLTYWLITQVNSWNPLGDYMTMYPALLVLFAYVTIVWELLFLFLAWRGWARVVMLSLGVMFHVGTMLLLGLYIFPLVCFSLYFAFADEPHMRTFRVSLRRMGRKGGLGLRRFARFGANAAPGGASRRRLPAPAAFAFAVAGVALGATELEYWIDPYGSRQEGGPPALAEISPERARELLAPSPAIRDQDLVFSFQLGTTMFGSQLVGLRDEFRHGETMLAQVKFNPPHGDLWIECNLHDGDGHAIDEVGQVVPRESLRSNWYFPIDRGLDPGKYSLVLKNAGREIERRPFRIVGDGPSRSLLNAN